MNREEDPSLWDLLGRLRGPKPSPFFARNVVRALRTNPRENHGLTAWFNRRRLIPALSGAVAIAMAAFTFQVLHQPRSPQHGFASTEIQDSELAADLEILVSNDDDSDDSDDALLL